MNPWLAYVLGIVTPAIVWVITVSVLDVRRAIIQHRKGYGSGLGSSWGYECPSCKGLIYSRPWPGSNWIFEALAIRQAKRDHLRYWTTETPTPPADVDATDPGWVEYRDRMLAVHQA